MAAARNLTTADLDALPGPQMRISTDDVQGPFVGASTKASVTRYYEVYKPDYRWIALLILSTVILIVTGIVGMALGSQANGPDLFDPVIGLTYDNNYLHLPCDASTQSATERAKLLGHLKVRLGDVQPNAETGKIGVGLTSNVGRLDGSRLHE